MVHKFLKCRGNHEKKGKGDTKFSKCMSWVREAIRQEPGNIGTVNLTETY